MTILRKPLIQYTRALILGIEQNKNLAQKILANRRDRKTLVIGDGKTNITPDKILASLQENEHCFNPHTVFSLIIHGMDTKISKGHYRAHNKDAEENTEEIIKTIHDFSQSLLLNTRAQGELTKIILNSCYAGTAQHIDLPDNTLLFACGTQYHETLSNFPLVIKNLDLLQGSTKALGYSLCEMGETCYIIKKIEDNGQECRKIRRPKTEEDFRELDKYYQKQLETFQTMALTSTQKLSLLGLDTKKALENSFLNSTFKGKLSQSQFNWYLENGMDIHHQNEHGQTALHYAANRGHIDIIDKLLTGLEPEDKIAFIKKKDNYEQTALNYAISKEKIDVIDKLLEGLGLKD